MMPNLNYVPSPEVIIRLARETPYSHVWWEHQLRLVLRTEMIPKEDLEDFARECVSCTNGRPPVTPAWAAKALLRLKNYPKSG